MNFCSEDVVKVRAGGRDIRVGECSVLPISLLVELCLGDNDFLCYVG